KQCCQSGESGTLARLAELTNVLGQPFQQRNAARVVGRQVLGNGFQGRLNVLANPCIVLLQAPLQCGPSRRAQFANVLDPSGSRARIGLGQPLDVIPGLKRLPPYPGSRAGQNHEEDEPAAELFDEWSPHTASLRLEPRILAPRP